MKAAAAFITSKTNVFSGTVKALGEKTKTQNLKSSNVYFQILVISQKIMLVNLKDL